jgi:ribosomal protein S18 acetylase RimI-like enzyme
VSYEHARLQWGEETAKVTFVNARRSKSVTLREYAHPDWPAVCRIHDAARVLELAAGHVDPRAFRPMVQVAEADEFFASQTVVACCGDAVVGFISRNGAYITWLYVEPAFHQRGIGRRLLDHALRQIGPQAWTNIIAGNEPALRLYRAAGLEVVCTKPGDCDGHPCHTIRLALPTSRMRNPAARR